MRFCNLQAGEYVQSFLVELGELKLIQIVGWLNNPGWKTAYSSSGLAL